MHKQKMMVQKTSFDKKKTSFDQKTSFQKNNPLQRHFCVKRPRKTGTEVPGRSVIKGDDEAST